MKYALLFVLLITLNVGIAQTSRGSFMVGGNTSYSTEKQKTSIYFFGFPEGGTEEANLKTGSFAVTPTAGYFLIDNLCVGFSFPFSETKSKAKQSGDVDFRYEHESRSANFAPFVRYYIPLQSNLYLLTGAGYGWGYARETYDYFHSENGVTNMMHTGGKAKFKRFNAGVGVIYFLNKNMGLELLAAYNSTSYEGSDDNVTGVVLAAGLQMYLHK